jgi:Domain of unknown function (DUF5606)
MELKEIASISGKGGLFKVMKPGKAGVILESLDAAKLKLVAGGKERMSVLSEISIYTTTKEGTVSLQEVITKIKKQYGAEIGVTPESDNAKLKAFLKSVLPEFDEDRVYISDIKKLVKWYSILLKEAPEVFEQEESKEEAKG